MFNFLSIKRRHRAGAQLHSQHSRRAFRAMRVEPMEGRLMLSASADEFTILNLNAVQYSLDAGYQTMLGAQLNDGGFISAPESLWGAGVVGNGVSPIPRVSSGLVPVLGNQDWISVDALNSAWPVFNAGNDLQPAVIGLDQDGVLNAGIGSTIAEYTDSIPAREEGGAIRIESILASVESMGNDPAEEASVKVPGNSERVANAATGRAEMDAVSGEWARAMVFEMAGGEPVARERPAVDERGAANGGVKPSIEGPFSSAHSSQSATGPAWVAAAKVHSSRPATREAGFTGAGVEPLTRPLMSEFGNNNGAESLWLASPGRADSTELLRGESGLADGRAVTSALEEVFEELGEVEEAGGYSLADYSRRALGATPLLLMLALERVAARNSRRAARQVEAQPGSAGKSLAETRRRGEKPG